MGTKGYMAPEMLSGKTYGFEVDWYSFGATYWTICTRAPIPEEGLHVFWKSVHEGHPQVEKEENEAIGRFIGAREKRPMKLREIRQLG
jgi:serine/threonine protein kinase